jgi:hypothetical protein
LKKSEVQPSSLLCSLLTETETDVVNVGSAAAAAAFGAEHQGIADRDDVRVATIVATVLARLARKREVAYARVLALRELLRDGGGGDLGGGGDNQDGGKTHCEVVLK